MLPRPDRPHDQLLNHDAVYRGRPDDEESSARRAEQDLATLGFRPGLVAEVARLVRLTASHDPAAGARNGEVLCDADLSILAAVRAEYAHVAAAEFADGRAKVLGALLGAPSLYRTRSARKRWAAAARANLAGELSGLTGWAGQKKS